MVCSNPNMSSKTGIFPSILHPKPEQKLASIAKTLKVYDIEAVQEVGLGYSFTIELMIIDSNFQSVNLFTGDGTLMVANSE